MKRNVIISILLVLCVFAGISSNNELNTKRNSDQNSGSLLDSILNYGLGFMGTPYHYGSTGPRSFDCSGFTSYVYRHFGYNIERDSRHQANQTRYVRKADLQKGDLVFFTSRRSRGAVGHVGIVLEKLENGEFRFIHASTNQGVTISSSDQDYYAARFVKGGRIVDYDLVPLDNTILYADNKTPEEKSRRSDEIENESSNLASEYHIVKRGENLNEISEKYDVPVTTLKQLNGLKNNKIKKGMKLKISEGIPQSLAGEELNIEEKREDVKTVDVSNNKEFAESNYSKHKVEKGETLFSIAKENNISVDDLKKINNLKSNSLSRGQIIMINKTEKPESKQQETAQLSVKSDIAQSSTDDVVSQLKELASSKTIKNSNKTQSDEFIEKVVYTKPLKHKVRKGETLSEIADNNNISLTELKKLNHLSSAKIKPGKDLIVREGKRTVKKERVKTVLADDIKPQTIEETVKKPVIESKQIEKSKEEEKTIVENTLAKHKVAKGETLYDIAHNNNMTVDELKQLNNLSSNNLQLGQVLSIKENVGKSSLIENSKPQVAETSKNQSIEEKAERKETEKKSTDTKPTKHKVVKGETLYDIARENDMTVNELKELNNISTSNLQLGQVLKVKKGDKNSKSEKVSSEKKKKEKSGITTHVVKSGESLFSIRRKYGCKLDQLKKWNNLSGENLKIGQKLIIYQ